VSLEWCRYRRRFKVPLRTGAGTFAEREGLLLRLDLGDGDATGCGATVGYGEIAPWRGFGGESIEADEEFLREQAFSLKNHLAERVNAARSMPRPYPIFSGLVPPELPLLHGAFEMLVATAHKAAQVQAEVYGEAPSPYTGFHSFPMPAKSAHTFGNAIPPTVFLRSAILVTLETFNAVLEEITPGQLDSPFPIVFKLKMTADTPTPADIAALLDKLPPRALLRLDANGAFPDANALAPWFKILADKRVDFIEQPFEPTPDPAPPRGVPTDLFHKIALDETISLADSLPDAPYGPIVVKPLLLGYHACFRAWLGEHPKARVIYSSCFETAFGREFALDFAGDDTRDCAYVETHGFGTLGFFERDGLEAHGNFPGGATSLGWVPLQPQLPSRWDSMWCDAYHTSRL